MNPTAYHQFDPVTGYMIPIEDPAPIQQNPVPPVEATTKIDKNFATEPVANQPADSSQGNLFLLYLLSVLTIIAGFAAWIRNKGDKISSSNLD